MSIQPISFLPNTNTNTCKPWVFDLIKQKLDANDQQFTNQALNPTKYTCKIIEMSYKSLPNTPFKFGVEMTIFDGQHLISAYIKATDASDNIKVEADFVRLRKSTSHITVSF
eukprot:53592_1